MLELLGITGLTIASIYVCGIFYQYVYRLYYPYPDRPPPEIIKVKDPMYELYPEVRFIENDDEYETIARKIMKK